MTGFVRTVTGDIQPDKLGYTHSHEHICVAEKSACGEVNPALIIPDYDKSLEEVKAFANAGGGTIVDAQPTGGGRMPRRLQKISKESGVNIIASTGFHLRGFYPANSRLYALANSDAAEVFTVELLSGMFEGLDPYFDQEITTVKAGVIKCALDAADAWDTYKELFTAASLAQTKTGAPMLIHTSKNSDVIGLMDFLDKRGVNLSKVIICHLDRTNYDLELHKEVLKRGAYVEYDTVGRYKYNDDETECGIIKTMLDAGYEDQILLGLDTTQERLISYGGTPGLTFIKEKFEDIAESYDIPKSKFSKFMIENPAHAFCFKN